MSEAMKHALNVDQSIMSPVETGPGIEEMVDDYCKLKGELAIMEKKCKLLNQQLQVTLKSNNVTRYECDTGVGVTMYDGTSSSWDTEYLNKVLSPAQIKRARLSSTFTALRTFGQRGDK